MCPIIIIVYLDADMDPDADFVHFVIFNVKITRLEDSTANTRQTDLFWVSLTGHDRA